MQRTLLAARVLPRVFRPSSLSYSSSTFLPAYCQQSASSACTRRELRTSAILSGTPEDLEKAKGQVSALTEDPGNDVKLKLYALYKQATIGQCNTKKPGMMDFVGQAKWDAWNSLGTLSQSEAIDQYCTLVNDLVGSATASSEGTGSSTEGAIPSSTEYKEILVTQEGGLLTITLNRPEKYNAMNYQMYSECQKVLIEAGEDDSVVVAMITGAGDYFCSGNDLSKFFNIPPEGPAKIAAETKQIIRDFVSSFIDFPKPLIAAINGPAIGISVTVLGLCDFVYASDKATFHTPFTSLGQSPEGCSSFLFPRIMGSAKAGEMLLGGKKLTAKEAIQRNLVADVFPDSEFREKVKEIAMNVSRLPPQSLSKSKLLIRDQFRKMFEEANIIEFELLEELWQSDEYKNAITNFMKRKK